MTVAPAEFTTFTDTVPVVMPRNEKPLKPGLRDWVPRVVLPLVTIAERPVWPAATRIPAYGEVSLYRVKHGEGARTVTRSSTVSTPCGGPRESSGQVYE